MLFGINNVLAVLPETQINNIISQPSITVVYPRVWVVGRDSNIIFPFDILNSTFFKLDNITTTCTYNVVNMKGEGIVNGNLFYDNILNYWYFNMNSTQTSTKGNYNFYVYCNSTQEAGFVSDYFDINAGGIIVTTANAIVYVSLLVICVILLLLCTFGAFSIDGKNTYDLGGGLMKVNFNKYLKIGLFFLSYQMLTFVIFFAWQISDRFLLLDIMTDIFRYIFLTLVILLAPLFICFVIIALIKWTLDLQLWKLKLRGLKPR